MSPTIALIFLLYLCYLQSKNQFYFCNTELMCYLQEKVFILLGKVMEAKKLYIQEGNLHPTKEELARRVGVTVEKIDKLLFSARIPISMQQTVWADQNTTFQVLCAS